MNRFDIIETIGKKYWKHNIENGEYSYVSAAGSLNKLEKLVNHEVNHYKLDIRFASDEVVILVETKQKFVKDDENQLAAYLDNEIAVHGSKKVICILANILNDKIKVYKNFIDDDNLLKNETTLRDFEHYSKIFKLSKQNEREKVLKNTLALNVLLHKMDIKESLRSQFVGTTLLYLKEFVKNRKVDKALIDELNNFCENAKSSDVIITAIKSTLDNLLNDSENKDTKIKLLQKNVLENQKVKNLSLKNWIEILDTILVKIYRYIDMESDEGQDILNLFFIAFNKYTGKADKNQAFTPDHITDFMCRLVEINRKSVVIDITCGSGSFLVQAMVKALADCHGNAELMKAVKSNHIYGIESEEKAYGLATTNMLIHGDGNSNIIFKNCFDCADFIIKAAPDIILMNPPYNAKPMSIPAKYKTNWTKDKSINDDEDIAIKKSVEGGKEDPTKGLVFIHFLSDVVKQLHKEVKLAVLLPVSAAIGTSKIIAEEKSYLLKNNTLEAVFTLPNEIFYPGASVNACCMLFTLGKPHFDLEGTPNKKTFFGYFKDDGFKKKKNLGRVEQFNEDGKSRWKITEARWLSLFRNKEIIDGLSAMAAVGSNDEWLCEAYMETDYSMLTEADFQQTINDYLAYLIKSGKKKLKSMNPLKLNINEWKEFKINDLFDVTAGNYYYSNEYDEGDTPYVTASDTNNGIAKRINLSPDFEGNVITIGKIGATTYYQSENFCATSDVNILKPKFTMNKHIGIFIAQIINYSENYKWSYGRQCRIDDSKNITIKLPTTNEGEPDYKFMENYVKELNCELPTTDNQTDSAPPLNINEWKKFKIKDFFDVELSKGDIKFNEMDKGTIPLVSSGETNNGIVGYIDIDGDGKAEIFPQNCITIDMFGNTFYQDKPFYAVSHGRVNILKPKFNLTKNIGIFISAIINQEQYKYSYGRAVYSNVAENMNIKLPVDSNDNPDWQFIENYIKSLPYGDNL